MLSDEQNSYILARAMRLRARQKLADTVRFDPVAFIENDLMILNPLFDYHYVEELYDGDVPIDAQVTFSDQGVLLKIADQTYIDAVTCVRDDFLTPQTFHTTHAAFTLCHEIGHIELHYPEYRAKKKSKRVSEAFARGQPGSGTSFRTSAKQEHEANIFAGCLMAPISGIYDETSISSIQIQYRVSKSVAIRIKHQREKYGKRAMEIYREMGSGD